MSVENINRIGDAFVRRLDGLDRVPDPAGFLREMASAFSRDLAEKIFFKVQTEPGWTTMEAQALADRFLEEQVLGLTDTIHAHGGTLDMVLDVARVAADAYGARLAELAAGYGHGGAA